MITNLRTINSFSFKSTTLSNSITNRIFILQKSAIRIMSFESRQTNCNLLFQKLNILKFFDLVQTQNIIFLHKLLNGNIPSELQETFKLLTIEFSHDTRNKNYLTFTVPHINTQQFGTYSIKYQCISSWHFFSKQFTTNNLNKSPLSKIKTRVNKFYLNSYSIQNLDSQLCSCIHIHTYMYV